MSAESRRRWARRLCGLGAGLVACGALAQTRDRGFADAVLGRWDVTVGTGAYAYPSWLEIRLRTEGTLMGRFVGRFGSMRYASNVSYADGVLELEVPVQYEQQKEPLRFTGRFAAGGLEGTTLGEDGRRLKWTARRAPALERADAPVWGEPVELFNGRDLGGWRLRQAGHDRCWRVAGGVLGALPPCVDLVSERVFEDFRLELELRIPEGSNSGIYLRGRYEVQLQDDADLALDPLRMGAVYGFIAPSIDAAKPPNEWQSLDITLLGRRVTIVLNGRTIIDRAAIPGITGGALDSDESAPGPIMLQGDHGPIEFRRITLTPAD